MNTLILAILIVPAFLVQTSRAQRCRPYLMQGLALNASDGVTSMFAVDFTQKASYYGDLSQNNFLFNTKDKSYTFQNGVCVSSGTAPPLDNCLPTNAKRVSYETMGGGSQLMDAYTYVYSITGGANITEIMSNTGVPIWTSGAGQSVLYFNIELKNDLLMNLTRKTITGC